MEKLIIEGGRPLEGTVRTAGSKNAVLPIMAASILSREPLNLTGVPQLSDVRTMLGVLRELGAEGEFDSNGNLTVSCAGDLTGRAGWESVRKMRGSVCVLGPLLARLGRVEVSLPGGCVFGVRPIEVHLKGLRALGARVEIERGFIVAEAPEGGLRGTDMYLGSAFGSSVLGTANVLMAATLARGTTTIQGAACEPEIVDLADCLNSMGARVSGQGSPFLTIEGVDELKGADHPIIPDRIEAGTYVIAGCLAGGRVRVEGCRPDHLAVVLDSLAEAELSVEVGEDWIETQPRDTRSQRPRPTDVTTHPYPGFPTDLQAQWMTLMTSADGLSIVTECIYPDRFMHIPELARLGASVRRQGTAALVSGTERLSGAPVTASDLRASAALVLAGLVADGTTEVHRVYHIDRGYERIEDRLTGLGAAIRREAE
ncbi:MAG: UDP-N-acetylglucosamine 1-carboxyvinyltransferase [Planctomycetota bacterium]|nr:UDP-N-acetylglucosamine 1-carboxyvinyltransferase [Planctomycetota bacterium]